MIQMGMVLLSHFDVDAYIYIFRYIYIYFYSIQIDSKVLPTETG